MKKTIFTIIFIMLTFASIEAVLHLIDKIYLIHTAPIWDEVDILYRYDNLLGWFPIENKVSSYSASKKISIAHNSYGFRDTEHTSDKPRIMFIGDSFVYGYDVDANERFTEKLIDKMPDFDILNCGVSGYGTDQTYLLLRKYIDEFKPDTVFLIFSNNDRANNSTNYYHHDYYKPYFIIENDQLVLKGVPVPKNVRYYIKRTKIKSYVLYAIIRLYYAITNPKYYYVKEDPTEKIILEIKKETDKRNINFVIGFAHRDAQLEQFLSKQSINYIILENPYVYVGYGKHWTNDGHDYAARKIYDFLSKMHNKSA
jgi:hypothetical protein